MYEKLEWGKHSGQKKHQCLVNALGRGRQANRQDTFVYVKKKKNTKEKKKIKK